MIDFNQNKETSYLVPVDANNLYGDAMSFKLPQKGFAWCTAEGMKELESESMIYLMIVILDTL